MVIMANLSVKRKNDGDSAPPTKKALSDISLNKQTDTVKLDNNSQEFDSSSVSSDWASDKEEKPNSLEMQGNVK